MSIPVQVTNGVPSLPTHFVQEDKLVKLTKETVYIFVKDKNNFKMKSAKDKFSSQRSFGELDTGSVVTPASLEPYANIEDSLVEAASSFSVNQIKLARNVVASHLSSFGIPNVQLKVLASNDKTLTFSSSIPTDKGRVEVSIPVDMPNGSPVIPSKFSLAGESFSLSESGLRKVIDNTPGAAHHTVSREVEEMRRLSYQQLISEVAAGVSAGDLRRSEDAMSVIQSKFGGERYKSALDTFSKMLKHASSGGERETLIKAALDRGDLIRVPTSVQLYCPKLGLPVSKVAFDDKGRPVPAVRKVSSDSIEAAGAMINSSKIVLS